MLHDGTFWGQSHSRLLGLKTVEAGQVYCQLIAKRKRIISNQLWYEVLEIWLTKVSAKPEKQTTNLVQSSSAEKVPSEEQSVFFDWMLATVGLTSHSGTCSGQSHVRAVGLNTNPAGQS